MVMRSLFKHGHRLTGGPGMPRQISQARKIAVPDLGPGFSFQCTHLLSGQGVVLTANHPDPRSGLGVEAGLDILMGFGFVTCSPGFWLMRQMWGEPEEQFRFRHLPEMRRVWLDHFPIERASYFHIVGCRPNDVRTGQVVVFRARAGTLLFQNELLTSYGLPSWPGCCPWVLIEAWEVVCDHLHGKGEPPLPLQIFS